MEVTAFPTFTRGRILLSFTQGQCALSWGVKGGGCLSLWLQPWLTAGDVMHGVNQVQPSAAVVCTGRSCPHLWGWAAAYGISKDVASAPHASPKGKGHHSSPSPGAGTFRVGQGMPLSGSRCQDGHKPSSPCGSVLGLADGSGAGLFPQAPLCTPAC